VLVFGPDGRFVRQVGKRGGGPGEFEAPVSIAIAADGSLAVFDLAHRNFSIFGADGAFRRSVPLPENAGMLARPIAPHPSGGVVGILRPMLMADEARSGTIVSRTQDLTLLPLAARGTQRKLFSLPDQTTAQTSNSGSGNRVERTVRVQGPPMFSPQPFWGVLPGGGVAIAHTGDYTVKVLDANGRLVRQIRRPTRVRRTTERDKERARERRREQVQSGRGMIQITRGDGPGGRAPRIPNRAGIEQQLMDMQFAETIPPIQGMTVAPSGKLWIERTPANVGDPGPIDVISASGQYLGTITGQRRPVAISAGGRAAYIEVDEDTDVERVIVRTLPAAWR
jgi:hypothetical protein